MKKILILKGILVISIIFLLNLSVLAFNINSLPEEDTLIVCIKAGMSILDPHRSSAYNDELSFNYGYDTLVTIDYDLTTIKNQLAKNWEVSDDGLVYIFKLKEGIKFHSGKPMTAHDVVYSFERWKNDKASPSRTRIDAMKQVEAIDEYTVKFTLEYPSDVFLLNLSEPYAAVLNEEAVEKSEQGAVPYGSDGFDGTGPYKFLDWKRDEYILFERFEDYKWASDRYENEGPAKCKYLLVKFIPDTGTRMMEFEAGNLDLLVGDALPATEIDRLIDAGRVTVEIFPQNYADLIYFNLEIPVLQDVNVRRAVNYAIDKEVLVETVFSGYATPANSPITPTSFGYWKGLYDAAYAYDPEKANSLLEESGWEMASDGFRYKDGEKLQFNLLYGIVPEYESGLPMIQAYLREIGIDLELVPMDWGAFFAAINNQEHDTYVVGYKWINSFLVYRSYHSDKIPVPNRMNYANTEVDRLIITAEKSVDPEAREAAWVEFQRIILEDAPICPLYHKIGWMGASRKLIDYKPHAFIGTGTNIPIDFYKTK